MGSSTRNNPQFDLDRVVTTSRHSLEEFVTDLGEVQDAEGVRPAEEAVALYREIALLMSAGTP